MRRSSKYSSPAPPRCAPPDALVPACVGTPGGPSTRVPAWRVPSHENSLAGTLRSTPPPPGINTGLEYSWTPHVRRESPRFPPSPISPRCAARRPEPGGSHGPDRLGPVYAPVAHPPSREAPAAPLMSSTRFFFVLFLSCAGTALSVNDARAQEPLSLERAVSLAAAHNETALAAGARAEAAEARVARARAFFLPRLSVTGGYTRRPQETTREVGGETVVVQRYNALRAGVIAQVQLFDARGVPLYQAAARDREASALDALETRRQVAFQAATGFLSTLGLEQVAEAAQRRLDLSNQSLEEARARASAGLASTNDVTLAELDVATAEATLADARGTGATNR